MTKSIINYASTEEEILDAARELLDRARSRGRFPEGFDLKIYAGGSIAVGQTWVGSCGMGEDGRRFLRFWEGKMLNVPFHLREGGFTLSDSKNKKVCLNQYWGNESTLRAVVTYYYLLNLARFDKAHVCPPYEPPGGRHRS